MKSCQNNFSGRRLAGPARRQRSRTRGMALVTTLILLALLGAASLAMVLLVSSDTMINGYYRNYRGSFYAADSGVNVAVEAMKNAIQNGANIAGNPPLPTGAVAIPTQAQLWVSAPGTFPPGLPTAYAPFQGSYYRIGDTGSWNGQFKMLAANPDGQPILGTPQFELTPNPNDAASCLPITLATCPNGKANTKDYIWTFSYPYEVTVQGQSSGSEAEQISQTGTIVYASLSGSASANMTPSFAKWGAFINKFADCQGALVPGTMSGPFFTNGQWNFGNSSNPGYTFTDIVGQSGANVSWWNSNKCTDSPTAPNGFKQPNFQAGLQVGQTPVTPPSNSYNQAQAVLDGKGALPCTSAPCSPDPPPSQTQMNQELKTIGGTPYPSSGAAPTGVYIPYHTTGTSPSGVPCTPAKPCYGSDASAGGSGYSAGFYVQGSTGSSPGTTITLSATTGCSAVCGASDPTQTYTIVQGSTTTTIVIDATAGVTVVNGTAMQGVPEQIDPLTNAPVTQQDPSGKTVNPALIYVNGQITGLSGTVQNDTGITIAASNNVSITGDLTYLQSPVAIPSDTLNSSTDAGVLGVYTTANINLYPNPSGSNKGNLTVDASLAAIGSGTSGFATPGGSIGTWTIVGGRSEDQAHGVSIGTGNTYYDRRFSGSFGPPWFPTAVLQPGQSAVPATFLGITVTRTSWREVSRP